MTDQAGPVSVSVSGQGMLAAAIRERLNADPGLNVIIRACDVPEDLAQLMNDADAPRDDPMLITASDGWDCRGFERFQALCAAHRVSWLPVRTELGRAVIGPRNSCSPRRASVQHTARSRHRRGPAAAR